MDVSPGVHSSSPNGLFPPQEEMDRKEKMTAGLNQTVRELQQLLQAVNRQLTKGQEGVVSQAEPGFASRAILTCPGNRAISLGAVLTCKLSADSHSGA